MKYAENDDPCDDLTREASICFRCMNTGYVLDLDREGNPTEDHSKPCGCSKEKEKETK